MVYNQTKQDEFAKELKYLSVTIPLQTGIIQSLERDGLESMAQEQIEEYTPRWEEAFKKARNHYRNLDVEDTDKVHQDIAETIMTNYGSDPSIAKNLIRIVLDDLAGTKSLDMRCLKHVEAESQAMGVLASVLTKHVA